MCDFVCAGCGAGLPPRSLCTLGTGDRSGPWLATKRHDRARRAHLQTQIKQDNKPQKQVSAMARVKQSKRDSLPGRAPGVKPMSSAKKTKGPRTKESVRKEIGANNHKYGERGRIMYGYNNPELKYHQLTGEPLGVLLKCEKRMRLSNVETSGRPFVEVRNDQDEPTIEPAYGAYFFQREYNQSHESMHLGVADDPIQMVLFPLRVTRSSDSMYRLEPGDWVDDGLLRLRDGCLESSPEKKSSGEYLGVVVAPITEHFY